MTLRPLAPPVRRRSRVLGAIRGAERAVLALVPPAAAAGRSGKVAGWVGGFCCQAPPEPRLALLRHQGFRSNMSEPLTRRGRILERSYRSQLENGPKR